MNIVKIHDADLREAAAKGLDDFVDVFYKAALVVIVAVPRTDKYRSLNICHYDI